MTCCSRRDGVVLTAGASTGASSVAGGSVAVGARRTPPSGSGVAVADAPDGGDASFPGPAGVPTTPRLACSPGTPGTPGMAAAGRWAAGAASPSSDLGPVALAFAGASEPADHRLMDELIRSHGSDGFPTAWLDARGLGWAADLIRQLSYNPEISS